MARKRRRFTAEFKARAEEAAKVGNRPFFDGDDCYRGQLLAGIMRYKFNQFVSSHIVAELFFPGDFYSEEFNEVAGFFRYQLQFTW